MEKPKLIGEQNMKKVDTSENPGLSKLPTEVRNKMGYMKKGGMAMKKGMHKMPDGNMMKNSDMPKKKMKMGGMAYKEGGKADMAQDKKTVKKAVGMHEKQLHGGKKSDLAALKKGGMAKKMAKGGGIEVRGKTKGKMCQENNMAVIEKIKKFVKDITPPSKEQKAKIEEKQMKMEEMKDPEAYRKNKAMYDVSTEVKKFDENYKKGGMVKSSASSRADGCAVRGKTRA